MEERYILCIVETMKKERPAGRIQSFLILLVMYLGAGFGAYGIAAIAAETMGPAGSSFWAAVTATVVLFIGGMQWRNSSVYDPFWSVFPVPVLVYWAWSRLPITAPELILIGVMSVWAVRLTLNSLVRWPGLSVQDWRYTELRVRRPKLWFLTNFFGIHLMPTLMVFIALLPAMWLFGISGVTTVQNTSSAPHPLLITGALIILGGTIIEAAADGQMWHHKLSSNASRSITSGLWRYSRHPNYLGELMVWWGLWIASLPAAPWFTLLCPLAMTALFIFISIPMMERHLNDTKSDYRQILRTTPRLLPVRFGKKGEIPE